MNCVVKTLSIVLIISTLISCEKESNAIKKISLTYEKAEANLLAVCPSLKINMIKNNSKDREIKIFVNFKQYNSKNISNGIDLGSESYILQPQEERSFFYSINGACKGEITAPGTNDDGSISKNIRITINTFYEVKVLSAYYTN